MEVLEIETREQKFTDTTVPGSGNIQIVGLGVDQCAGMEDKVKEPQGWKMGESTHVSSHLG